MAEQEPSRAQLPDPQVAQALKASPAPVTDVRLGQGRRFRLGDGQLTVELYADTTTRLTTPTAQLELAGPLTVQAGTTEVVFTRAAPTDEVHATVRPDGTLIFNYIAAPPPPPDHPAPPPERPQQPAAASPAGKGPAPADAAPGAARRPSPAPTSPAAAPAPHPARAAQPEQAPRVQLTGRLGRDPTFRTTKDTGTRIARFPLAVHADDGTTRWHTVLAFGARAEQLQRRTQAGELAQGREVDVVGYLHTTTRPGRDGKPRTVQEIYAVAVTKR